MGDLFSWEFFAELFPKVLPALPQTLLIVMLATVFGIIIGIILVFLRLEKIPLLYQLATIFISFVRGTPILIQMFVVYYAFPQFLKLIGIDISDWGSITFIYITYSINTGAYFSEIFRSAILSVPKAQTDAAYSVGLTRTQTYLRVVIPQSVTIALPGVGVIVTNLLQDSSLAFTFGILDVIGKARIIGQLKNRMIEGYVVSAVIFVVLAIVFERFFAFLEKKNRVHIITTE